MTPTAHNNTAGITSDVATLTTFSALQAHHAATEKQTLRELFSADPQRFNTFSLEAAGLFLDYAKNTLTTETMSLHRFVLVRGTRHRTTESE
ncbi:hypothetical protein ACVBEF_19160, partial [Glaciimonas sp. GG7]